MELEDLKKLNPTFNFANYEICDVWLDSKDVKNLCLVPKEGIFHKIWLDKNGIIVNESLKLVKMQLKASNIKELLLKEISSIMCKPINRDLAWNEIYNEWDFKLKLIKQIEKGFRRKSKKEDKVFRENGGDNNKLRKIGKIISN